jgi:signal transduction histidine kinase
MDEDQLALARMRSLARLARTAAHEARGAVSAMVIHAELLATTLESVTDTQLRERQRRHLAVLEEARRRVQRVIEAFFGHAALPDTRPGEFDLADLAGGVVELTRPYGTERQVALELLRPSHGVAASGRRDVAQQVILDVVLWAIEQSPANERVELVVERGESGASLSIRVSTADWEASEVLRSEIACMGGAIRTDGRGVCVALGFPEPARLEKEADA